MYSNTEVTIARGQCPKSGYTRATDISWLLKKYLNNYTEYFFIFLQMANSQGVLHFVLVLLLQSSAVFCNDQEDISYKIVNPPHSGCEQEVKEGDNIRVNFIGTLKDGTEFVNT